LIRVAVFEDNKHLRETFELLLNNSAGFTCTGAYPDCRDLLDSLYVSPADVVLIQTIFFEDDYIFNAICAGASGYILKSTTPDGYLEAIKDVLAGGSPMTPGIARRVLELFKINLGPETPSKDYNLTAQEKKVLQLLVAGKSYKMIAAELYVSVETVKSHISNIYAKLHVHSGTEAVAIALRDKIV
jgi:DNA-binding NarL/FixJ family response regulator